MPGLPGLLSNQGKKSINLYFIRVPLRKKEFKYGTPKPSFGLFLVYFMDMLPTFSPKS